MTRDQYLDNISKQIYSSPLLCPYIQVIHITSKREYEKFIIHRSDGKLISEYWYWDWNVDFSRLTRKSNLELVANNQYEPAIKKTSRTVNPDEVDTLVSNIHKIKVTPQSFEFSDLATLNHGSDNQLEIRMMKAELIIKWINSPPREWSGMKEVLTELVDIVAREE